MIIDFEFIAVFCLGLEYMQPPPEYEDQPSLFVLYLSIARIVFEKL